MKLYTITFLIIILFSACTQTDISFDDKYLSEKIRIHVHNHPDSALLILHSSRQQLSSSHTEAFILYAKSRNLMKKLEEAKWNDSYFNKHASYSHYPSVNNKRELDSINNKYSKLSTDTAYIKKSYLDAINKFNENNDLLSIAYAYREIALMQGIYADTICGSFFQKAISLFKKENDTVALAETHLFYSNYFSWRTLLQSNNLNETYNDSAHYYKDQASFLMKSNEFRNVDFNRLGLYRMLYGETNNTTIAEIKHGLTIAEKYDSIPAMKSANLLLFNLYLNRERYKNAYDHYNKYQNLVNNENFIATQEAKDNAIKETRRKTLIEISIISVMLLFIILGVTYKKYRKKRKEIENQEKNLTAQTQRITREIDDLRKRKEKILQEEQEQKEQLASSRKIKKEYEEMKENQIEVQKYYIRYLIYTFLEGKRDELLAQIKTSGRRTDEEEKELKFYREYIETFYCREDERDGILSFNFIEKLKAKAGGKLTQEEVLICMMIFLKLKQKDIAQILRSNPSTLSKKMQTIYDKLHLNNKDEMAEFLEGIAIQSQKGAQNNFKNKEKDSSEPIQ